jgi:hypothetical protein
VLLEQTFVFGNSQGGIDRGKRAQADAHAIGAGRGLEKETKYAGYDRIDEEELRCLPIHHLSPNSPKRTTQTPAMLVSLLYDGNDRSLFS